MVVVGSDLDLQLTHQVLHPIHIQPLLFHKIFTTFPCYRQGANIILIPLLVNQFPKISGDADPVLLADLVDMGFPSDYAKQALIATNNRGIDQAIDWYFYSTKNQYGMN